MYKSIVLFCLLVLTISCSEKSQSGSIRIAVAANMESAIDSLVVLFEKEYSVKCELSVSSSGILTSQIENGAPFDVFVSANMAYQNALNSKKLSEKPRVYALGRLVLVYGKDKSYSSIEDLLLNDNVKKIAMADPDSAPYGQAAKEYLEAMKIRLDNKLVYGESISQVNQYLTLGTVEAVFTSHSFVSEFKDDYNYFEIDSKYFNRIEQGISVLEYGNKHHKNASNQFVDFMLSEKCKQVLDHFGYSF